MGFKKALAFRTIVDIVKLVPEERVRQRTFEQTADVPVQPIVDRRALPNHQARSA